MKAIGDLINAREILSHKVSLQLKVDKIESDSRLLREKSLFFAVRGHKSDGHSFLASLPQGAVAVIDRPEFYDKTERVILVKNSRSSLARAASAWFNRPSRDLNLVGVTGTNGKTTTVFLLYQAWANLGLVTGTIGTVEYRIGTKVLDSPLTTPGPLQWQGLLNDMRAASVSHVAAEVSSIALDQDRTDGTLFRVALFTNLTQDHLDYHADIEAYYQSKRRLFAELAPESVVINNDDKFGVRLAKETPVKKRFTFSCREKADFYPLKFTQSLEGLACELQTPEGKIVLRSPLMGMHNLSNLLGVLATAHALGQPLPEFAKALGKASGAPGRLEKVAMGQLQVFVDYAHTPDALKNVLGLLDSMRPKDGRIITVFGCGGDRDRTKRPQMAAIASAMSQVTILTSDNPRTENPDAILDEIEAGMGKGAVYHREPDRRKAIGLALSLGKPNDLILVAGKGHETYQIVGEQRLPFDDREVIRDYAKQSP